jgi:thiamine biosynthesis lipoprotein
MVCARSLLLVAALWLLPIASDPPATLHHYEAHRMSMACLYAIDMYGPDLSALPSIANEAFDEVDRIDRLMSNYKSDSGLSRVNREAPDGPVAVEPELFDLIADALRYDEESGGAFDITVGPLMKAWGFFRGEGRLPSGEVLTAARTHVGGRHVILDRPSRTIRFDAPGVELDLGGIAKGYAVDRVVAILRARSIPAALISAGGSTIYAVGAPPDRSSWSIAIQDPLDARKQALTIDVTDRALSIAGSSEKWFEADGVRYSHIMDPRTGRPVQGMLTVAVLAASGTEGDALDDALFVLGVERSKSYLRRLRGSADAGHHDETLEALFFLPDPAHGWKMVRQ